MSRGTCVEGAYLVADGWLCQREALEVNLLGLRHWLAEDLASWRSTVALAEASEDPGKVFSSHGGINLQLPPEGNDWLVWGRWVERRLAEVLEHPDSRHPELDSADSLPMRLGDPGLPPLSADPVPDAVRRWPTAANGFTEFFGQRMIESVDVGWDQTRMLTSRSLEWRTSLAGECDELLRLEDDTLRATVFALGSVVVPATFRLRLWLTWMAWRIREFDWS